MGKEWKSLELWRSVIAECLATFFYVFLACTVTLNWTPNVYRTSLLPAELLQISLSFGLALSTLTLCFSHISGGHFNPAVTIATLVTCKVTPLRGFLYVVVRCGGAIAGAALLYGIVPERYRGLLGATLLDTSLTTAQGAAVEFLLTFVFTFTYFATGDPRRRNHGNEAIPLGLTMTLLHIVGYRLTGSSCNPARSLGPAFVRHSWAHHWVYWCGPIGGAVVAALLYQFVFAQGRGFKPRASTLAGIQQINGQSETAFTIYGNAKNKSAKKHSKNACLPAPSGGQEMGNTSEMTTVLFHTEAHRKYMRQTHGPPAPPGSIETGLDVEIPPDMTQDVTFPMLGTHGVECGSLLAEI